jgi:hypothetical protein
MAKQAGAVSTRAQNVNIATGSDLFQPPFFVPESAKFVEICFLLSCFSCFLYHINFPCVRGAVSVLRVLNSVVTVI